MAAARAPMASWPHRDEPGGGPEDASARHGAPDGARHGACPRGGPTEPGGGPEDASARRGACPRGGPIPSVRAPRVPIYTPHSVRVVHNLRYDWTGWLDPAATDLVSVEQRLPAAMASCRAAWPADGITLDTWTLAPGGPAGARLQCLFTASPEVSPTLCAGRAKGRLDHALRQAGARHRFTRNIGFRALGDNTRDVVESYIGRQAAKSDYVDPRFKAYLGRFAVDDATAMLAAPFASGHGRYWYNLHLVIVVADRRFPMTRHETFTAAGDTCFRIAAKKGHRIAALSVMPDHLHLALRGNVEHSPVEIGLGFLNNLAFVLGHRRCWSEEFYVGTFSEYGVGWLRGAG